MASISKSKVVKKEQDIVATKKLGKGSFLNLHSHSFDLIPSSRNLTSFKALLEGFQSSNSFSSALVSSVNSRLTYSSSSKPRMANGKMYGFELGKG